MPEPPNSDYVFAEHFENLSDSTRARYERVFRLLVRELSSAGQALRRTEPIQQWVSQNMAKRHLDCRIVQSLVNKRYLITRDSPFMRESVLPPAPEGPPIYILPQRDGKGMRSKGGSELSIANAFLPPRARHRMMACQTWAEWLQDFVGVLSKLW